MKVEIYTDGACSKNGQPGARASWAFYLPAHESLSKAGCVPPDDLQSNQRGELMGLSEAVKAAETAFPVLETDLKLYTDSLYAKNCLTLWLPAWIRKGWKTTQGQDVQHRDLIEDTANRLSRFKTFNIIHVKAHTGGSDEQSRHNATVDRMAVRALEPPVEGPKIVSNTQDPFETCPLKLMGPPVSEHDLVVWCRANIDQLDLHALNSALLVAFGKTVKAKGYEVVKQRLRRSAMYRLKTEGTFIQEGVHVIKEE